jgi:hypothetical protein
MDYAVDTALALVKAALLSPPKEDILAAFLGDENTALSSSPRDLSHMGLRDLLTLPAMPENWIICYLDLEKPPETILIRHGSDAYIAPLDIVKPLPALFGAGGIRAKFEIHYNDLYKLFLAVKNEVLDLAWQGEINGFSLAGGNSASSAATDSSAADSAVGGAIMESGAFASILLEYAGALEFPVRNPDRHYSFFTLPFSGKIIFIGEKALVLIFIILMALILLFGLSYSAAFRTGSVYTVKMFFRHSWIFLVFLPLPALLIKGSGFFYNVLLFGFNKPAPTADYPGLVFILFLAVWLFYILLGLVDSLKIPGKDSFYGGTAVILSGFGLLIAALIDFTYTGIRGEWLASLELAFLFLPFFFLLKKGAFLFNLKLKLKRQIWNISLKFRFAFLGLILLGVLSYVFTLPASPALQIRRQIMDDSFTVIKAEGVYFRESRILEISFEAKKTPARFDIYLESGGDEGRAIVYSAPFPFDYTGNGEIAFVLGENPRNPLKAEIVLPRNPSPAFRVCAVYDTYDGAIDPQGEPESRDYEFTVISRSSLSP